MTLNKRANNMSKLSEKIRKLRPYLSCKHLHQIDELLDLAVDLEQQLEQSRKETIAAEHDVIEASITFGELEQEVNDIASRAFDSGIERGIEHGTKHKYKGWLNFRVKEGI